MTTREQVKSVYPRSKKWHDKVDHMSEDQVVAVYMRFRAIGKL